MAKKGHPTDDPSSAPESGTERDETSGSPPADRGAAGKGQGEGKKDDAGTANEEK